MSKNKLISDHFPPLIIIYLLAVGLGLILCRFIFWDRFIHLVEVLFSSDGFLEANGVANLKNLMMPMAGLHLSLGLIGFIIFNSNRIRSIPFFNQTDEQPSVLNFFLTSSLSALYIYGLLFLPKEIIGIRLPIHREDSLMEYLTVIAYITAAFFFARILLLIRKSELSRSKRLLTLFYALLIFACVLIAGEELSWGQRILGWETPLVLKEINYQDETNLHNMLSPLRKEQAVLIAAIIFPIIILGGWLKLWAVSDSIDSLYFPHPAMFIALVLLSVSGAYDEELFEELAALFVLLYAGWMWSKWKITTLARSAISI